MRQAESRRRAFTLIELLVVIAIVAILASLLFPVFAQAKVAAKRTVWMNSFKQTNLGYMMYLSDNDDGVPPSNVDARSTGGSGSACWGCGWPSYPNDRTWVQLVNVYVKNWYMWRCPGDPNSRDEVLASDPFTNRPYPPAHPNYYYQMSARSHIGLNYSFISPWVYSVSRNLAGSLPVNMSRVAQPASTLYGVESIWDRDSRSGTPIGGGNWVVEAPCVRDQQGNFIVPVEPTIWFSYGGWIVNQTGGPPYSWREFGGAWPWFMKRFQTAYLDGHARSVPLGRLMAGCDVRSRYGGPRTDPDLYLYDVD
ncbi:MAG: type II secretion system protein [Fimbriimonadaceae bacterium]